MQSVRLQKLMAECGIASRRKSAEVVASGKVAVNGAIILEPGFRVNPDTDVVTVSGKAVKLSAICRRTIMMYKPRGYVCSKSGQGGKTVYELLREVGEGLVPAGRLDKNSEGLLLMSNDGAVVNRIAHPGFGHAKVYNVTVSGSVGGNTLAKLRERIVVDGHVVRPAKARLLRCGEKPGRTVLEIKIGEGRKRQVRELCRHAGLVVHRLVRVRVGDLSLAGLRPGQWRDLTVGEIRKIMEPKAGSQKTEKDG